MNDHSYDVEKRPRRTPKTHRPAKDLPKERRSTYSIRTVLKNICIQFLECCYNPLMKVVKVMQVLLQVVKLNVNYCTPPEKPFTCKQLKLLTDICGHFDAYRYSCRLWLIFRAGLQNSIQFLYMYTYIIVVLMCIVVTVLNLTNFSSFFAPGQYHAPASNGQR